MYDINHLIERSNSNFIWDREPVFSFTSDIDWASEAVMQEYFDIVNPLELNPTLFVTHHSEVIEKNFKKGSIERGIHPNFMEGSSHGNTFIEIAETSKKFAPEAYGFRSHRAFDVTDITHLMHNEFGFKYVSNQITIFQPFVKPILHESGLINFPVFFEDGTQLYNQLDLNFKKYQALFHKPGIKIISFHPMNFVFNSPTIKYMRSIKDSLSRKEYNNISAENLNRYQNKDFGIRNTVLDIIEFVKKNDYKILSMNYLYNYFVEDK